MKKITVLEISNEDLRLWLVECKQISSERINNVEVMLGYGIKVTLSPRDESHEQKKLLGTKIEDHDFTVRLINNLKALGVVTVGDILKLTRKRFATGRNVGKKSIDELEEFLKVANLNFAQE